MPLHPHHHEVRGLPALGANLAGLAGALATTAVFAGTAAMRTLAARLIEGKPRESCRQAASTVTLICGRRTVRHHYRYCCVPRCHGCGE
jgi:hypothetical protein